MSRTPPLHSMEQTSVTHTKLKMFEAHLNTGNLPVQGAGDVCSKPSPDEAHPRAIHVAGHGEWTVGLQDPHYRRCRA